MLFSATDASGDTELWRTDGTVGGTEQVTDLNPLKSSAPSELTRVGDRVVFFARTAGFSSDECLAVSDGTAAGTFEIFDGSASGLGFLAGEGFAVIGDLAYFLAWTPGGIELWSTDLTPAGTAPVGLVTSSPYSVHDYQLTAAGDRIFLRAQAGGGPGSNLGAELFVSDGTVAGTHLVVDFTPGPGSTFPDELTPAHGGVYFVPDDAELGGQVDPPRELHFSDGTAAGTYAVGTRPPGTLPTDPTELLSSTPTGLILVDGALYFAATDHHGVGRELYRLKDPGAYVQVLEPSGSGQELAATEARLGQSLVVSGTGAPSGQVSLLVMSATVTSPSSLFVAPGSASWGDPLGYNLLGVHATAAWSQTLFVPPSVDLLGLNLTVQSWTLGSPSLLPAETSNGVALVIGP